MVFRRETYHEYLAVAFIPEVNYSFFQKKKKRKLKVRWGLSVCLFVPAAAAYYWTVHPGARSLSKKNRTELCWSQVYFRSVPSL